MLSWSKSCDCTVFFVLNYAKRRQQAPASRSYILYLLLYKALQSFSLCKSFVPLCMPNSILNDLNMVDISIALNNVNKLYYNL